MNIQEAIEDLEQFNMRLDELAHSRFFSKLQGDWQVVINLTGQEWASVMDGPDRDAIKSAINDHRLFQQDNDRIALHKIAKIFHGLRKKLLITDEHLQSFDGRRQQVLDWWTSGTPWRFGDHVLKRFELMDIFIYGDITHLKREKQRVFVAWKASQAFGMLQVSFVDAIARTIVLYGNVADVNKQVIEHLRATNHKLQFTTQELPASRPNYNIHDNVLKKLRENIPSGAFDFGMTTTAQNLDGTTTTRGIFPSDPCITLPAT